MSKAKPTDDKAPADLGLDTKSMEAIGRALRAHYDDLVNEPLPKRFHELIAKLGAKDESAPDGGASAAS